MSSLSATAAQKAMFAVGGPVDLRKYTKLKPDVASQLRCDAEIDLSGLKDFTPALAEAFKYHREGLILNGLKLITPETAAAFREHFEGKLTLNGLETLDDQAALHLALRTAGSDPYKYWPKTILEGIDKLSDSPGHLALFEKLASCENYQTVTFREITPTQAEILVRVSDKIDLWKIKRITPEVAKILSRSSKTISMNYLEEISSEAAAALSDHSGHLSLTGLKKVDAPLALALSSHKGSLALSGLEEMPDHEGFIALAESLVTNSSSRIAQIHKVGEKVAEILANRPELGYSLKEFSDTEGHKRLLRAICAASDKATVEFWGMHSIPDAVLQILVDCPKKVAVNSLAVWTEEPAHIRLAERMVENQLSGSATDSLYVNGERFPDKIAAIFSRASKVSFQNLKELDDSPGNLALTQKLVDSGAWLSLKKISAPAAQIIRSKPGSNLSTGELVELSVESFPIIFPPGTSVYLSHVKDLPAAVASQMEDERSISLDGLPEISLPSATHLSRGKGSLSLKGLKQVRSDVLAALASRPGELNLSGLVELSAEQARILADHKGGLVLDGLENVTPEALDILAGTDPESLLSMESVREVPDSTAAKLSSHPGSVRLSSISELSAGSGHVSLARKLAKSNWKIEFKNLSNLSPDAARELVSVSDLSLGGLEKMDPALAAEFSAYQGTLKLPSLNEVNLDAARELGKAPCDQQGMELGFIEPFSAEVLSAMTSGKKRLSLKASHLTEEKTRAIVKIPSLYIEELETIDLDCAKCFNGYKGSVYFSSLKRLDPEAAATLRKLGRKISTNRAGEIALSTGL